MLVSFLQNELFIHTLLSVPLPSFTDDAQVFIYPLMDGPVIAASPTQLVWRPIFQMTSWHNHHHHQQVDAYVTAPPPTDIDGDALCCKFPLPDCWCMACTGHCRNAPMNHETAQVALSLGYNILILVAVIFYCLCSCLCICYGKRQTCKA